MVYPQFVDSTFENKILEISTAEYHSRKDCVHSSSLKNILKSPHAYNYFLNNHKAQTASMAFGTMAHEALLEGESFLRRYVVQPVFKGLTKDGKETTSMAAASVKEQHQEWLKTLPTDSVIMSQDEFDKLRFMMDSLLNHKFVQEILKDGLPEHKMQWKDPVTNLACISANDFVSYKNDIWVDVKTTTSCDWFDFRRNGVEKFRYDFQAAFYMRGFKAVHGKEISDKVWIALENQAPWECKVHFVDPYYLEAGEYSVKKAMSDLAFHLKENKWPQGQVVVEAGEPSKFFKESFDGPLLEEMR